MKKIVCISFILSILISCNEQSGKGKFSVTGEIKNAPDQKVYLEEIFFSQRNPEVLDTGEIKSGRFALSAMAPEEGLYRIRLEKDKAAFIFINDQSNITLNGDFKTLSFNTISYNTPANNLLKHFINGANDLQTVLADKSKALKEFVKTPATDSLYNELSKEYELKVTAYKKYVMDNVDSLSDPVVALFALGYSRNVETERVDRAIANLAKRFPKSEAVSAVVTQYKQEMERAKQEEAAQNATPHVGSMAPDISMENTEGKPFSLSSLKGKYVLVDFWASWCGPCRAENPNVVKAYNMYKDKNFTVLGVSLDKSKEAWLDAIKSDNLTWYHISDLKQWNSAAVNLYGFDGIPYNVLVDPQGKIIADNLRGDDLENKLAEVLK